MMRGRQKDRGRSQSDAHSRAQSRGLATFGRATATGRDVTAPGRDATATGRDATATGTVGTTGTAVVTVTFGREAIATGTSASPVAVFCSFQCWSGLHDHKAGTGSTKRDVQTRGSAAGKWE